MSGGPSGTERWRGFLSQIEGRHTSVLAEAEAELRAFIETIAAAGDDGHLSRQLTAVDSRLHELESMIIDTWNDKVSNALDAEDVDADTQAGLRKTGVKLKDRLEGAREELPHRLYVLLATRRFAHAFAAVGGAGCSSCGAPLSAPAELTRYEVQCHLCGAVTRVELGDAGLMVAAMASHHVSQYGAREPWRQMRAAERAFREERPPVALQTLTYYEAAQIEYWRAYFAIRGSFEPALSDLQREVTARMAPWYRDRAEYESAWVSAGRPRLPI